MSGLREKRRLGIIWSVSRLSPVRLSNANEPFCVLAALRQYTQLDTFSENRDGTEKGIVEEPGAWHC